ncbi:MAG: dUTP diphosphatase [Tyzzerella sp.]|uniref:dUTP diphosphatase n=1 Tax=Candidatus Fimicola merdigallinarum TaxID=2840819 RepID=A0A9D9H0S7_9FIRM|nr:dUTP diphosphatase [Candidatus Fimicola merdigallinarum]
MQNIFLSLEQINEIREMQRELDERILSGLGIEPKDIALEKHLALKTELFELINEIESFKWWKKNKGKEHILEEGCDVLHFLLSLANDNEIEFIDVDTNTDMIDMEMNELLGIMDSLTLDMFIEKDYTGLNFLLKLLSIVLHKKGYNANDLYNAYISKNKVNHERQDNNY